MDNEIILEEQAKKYSFRGKLLIFTALLLSVPMVIYIGIVIIMTWNTTYHHFGKTRTEEMEEIFSITVTDDVKLVEFKDITFLTQIDKTLTLEVDDYEKFLNNNISAKVEIDDNTPFYEKDDAMYYKYDKIYVEITESDNEAKYLVILNYRD